MALALEHFLFFYLRGDSQIVSPKCLNVVHRLPIKHLSLPDGTHLFALADKTVGHGQVSQSERSEGLGVGVKLGEVEQVKNNRYLLNLFAVIYFLIIVV